MKKVLIGIAAIALLGVIGLFGYVYHGWGVYGVNGMLRNGGNLWIDVKRDDPRLSPAMRLALRDHIPPVTAGAFAWREVEPGFEVAEVPVVANGQVVDRLYLNRVDPARFDFRVGNAPNNDHDLKRWQADRSGTVLVINGSYFSRLGQPDTPVIIDGKPKGPQNYEAHAGAFVATPGAAHVVDLTGRDWHTVLQGANQAMVSYPLLVGEDGHSHVAVKSRWLANRSFVGEDRAGRIIIGQTQEAFFSLDRLADFLCAAPLDLKVALNLDGGPIADLGVRLKSYQFTHYGQWEAQGAADGHVRLLRQPVASVPDAMPMVLMIERRP